MINVRNGRLVHSSRAAATLRHGSGQAPGCWLFARRYALSARHGYAFLVTVLVVGIMAAATATSLMLLGWAAEQNGLLVQQSAQAENNARSCIERALRALRSDPSYAGNETLTFARGSCVLHPIVGDGVNDRRICAEGTSGKTTRRFQASVAELFPRVKMSSFDEVAVFTLCP